MKDCPWYRSTFEEDVAERLKGFGIQFEHEGTHLPYGDKLYLPDFRLSNGIFLEVKGYFSQEDRDKMRKVKAAHPNLDIRLIFDVPDHKIEHSEKSYREWAEHFGFPWSDAEFSREWLDAV